ncbi:MAG: PilN domain-containing protein [Bacteroidota bacterium]
MIGFDRVGAAVVAGSASVRYVELSARRGRIRVRRQSEVAIGPGGVDAALKKLARAAGSRFVATALPEGVRGPGVTHAPPLADDEDRREWLEAQAASRMGPSQVGAAGLVETERGAWALHASADEEAVHDWTTQLERAGFQVLRMGDGHLEAASPLAATGALTEGTVVVQSANPTTADPTTADPTTGRATRIRVEQGRPAEVVSGRSVSGEASAVLAEVATAPSPHVALGEGAGEAARELESVYGTSAQVATVLEDARGGPLGPEWAPVVGLALEEVYPGLRVLEVGDPETTQATRQEARASHSKRRVLALAVLALVLLGGVRLGQAFVDRELDRADEALLAQADDLVALGLARSRVERLRTQAGGGEGRTAMALIYQAVGRALPEGVWLESLEVEPDGRPSEGGTGRALRVTAFSVDALGAEAAVEALATSGRVSDVRLQYIERVQPAPGLPEGLVRFEVEGETQ